MRSIHRDQGRITAPEKDSGWKLAWGQERGAEALRGPWRERGSMCAELPPPALPYTAAPHSGLSGAAPHSGLSGAQGGSSRSTST